MKMLDFYKSILEDANMSVSMDGYVSVTPIKGGSSLPATISNKRLVLPTQEILMNADKSNVIVFHPLYENIMGAESEVMTKLRKCYSVKLETVLASIAHRLLEICCTIPEHKRLNPEQSEILSIVGNVNEKFIGTFTKTITHMVNDDDSKPFISLYIKRGGSKDGNRYSRLCVVSFPFYEEIVKEYNELQKEGKKLVPYKLALKKLFEYILPNIDMDNYYTRGSNDEIAPSVHALMSSVKQLGSRTNEIIELFNGLIDNKEDLMFKGEWVESVDCLGEFLNEIRRIPMQAGNDGKPKHIPTPVVETQPPIVQNTQSFNNNLIRTDLVKTENGLSLQSILGGGYQQQQMQYGINPFQQQIPTPNRIPSSIEMQMMQNRQPTPFGFNYGMNVNGI